MYFYVGRFRSCWSASSPPLSRLPVDRQDPLHAPSGGDAHSLSLRPLLYSLLKPWGTPQSPDTPAPPWPLAVASAQPFSEPQNRRPRTRSLRLLHFMVIEVQAQPSSKTSEALVPFETGLPRVTWFILRRGSWGAEVLSASFLECPPLSRVTSAP